MGEYLDADGIFHGFLWRGGPLTTIDFPDASGTSPTGITDRRAIVGTYGNAGAAPSPPSPREQPMGMSLGDGMF